MKTLAKSIWRQRIVWLPFITLFVVLTTVFQLSCHMTLTWREQRNTIKDTYDLQFQVRSLSQPDLYYIKKSEIQSLFESDYIESVYTPTRLFAYVHDPITKVLWGAEEAGAYRRSDTENMIILQTIKEPSSVYEYISGQLFLQDTSTNIVPDCIHISVSNRLATKNGWRIDDIIKIELPGIRSEYFDCQITEIFYNTDDVAWMADNVIGEIVDNTVFVKWNELYPQYTESEFDNLDDFVTSETVFRVDSPDNYHAMMTDLENRGFAFDQYELIVTDDGYFSMMENLDKLQNTYRFMIYIVGILLVVLLVYLIFVFTKQRLTEFKVFYGMGFSEKHIFTTIFHQLSVYTITGIICASPISLAISGLMLKGIDLAKSAAIIGITAVILLFVMVIYSLVISKMTINRCKFGD